ncbi:hypothetical protein Strvi_7767 [Streptomyces violaceusniger Tu 4113]|uniref:Uncharacterized protein n=1 Tax=Streptomyces violaceusniger (strain Tu 4113) TaxID=653045 RepID=G2P7E1_STRV4|nr:hypothetical protein Strvi_7767 [Streptomyces violaceusniger Tu 4113]
MIETSPWQLSWSLTSRRSRTGGLVSRLGRTSAAGVEPGLGDETLDEAGVPLWVSSTRMGAAARAARTSGWAGPRPTFLTQQAPGGLDRDGGAGRRRPIRRPTSTQSRTASGTARDSSRPGFADRLKPTPAAGGSPMSRTSWSVGPSPGHGPRLRPGQWLEPELLTPSPSPGRQTFVDGSGVPAARSAGIKLQRQNTGDPLRSGQPHQAEADTSSSDHHAWYIDAARRNPAHRS